MTPLISEAFVIPRWSTAGLFILLVIQFLRAWIEARKAGKNFRSTVLPSALIAGGMSLIFVREFLGNLPSWIDATLAILVSLIMLAASLLAAVQLRKYLKTAWWLEWTRHKEYSANRK